MSQLATRHPLMTFPFLQQSFMRDLNPGIAGHTEASLCPIELLPPLRHLAAAVGDVVTMPQGKLWRVRASMTSTQG